MLPAHPKRQWHAVDVTGTSLCCSKTSREQVQKLTVNLEYEGGVLREPRANPAAAAAAGT